MIAVLNGNILWFLIFSLILIVIYKITKKQASPFFVIFLFTLMGFLVMSHGIRQREDVKFFEQKEVRLQGNLYKMVQSEYGWNLYLRDVKVKTEEKKNFQEADKNTKKILSGKTTNEHKKTYSKIIVFIPEAEDYKIGQRLYCSGKLSLFSGARNEGNFDAKKYYESLGIFAKVSTDSIGITDAGYDSLRQNLWDFREDIRRRLKKLCESKLGIFQMCSGKAEIFSAMLIGDKSEMDDEVRELYSISGISHILAISGLHITLIGMCFYKLLRKKFGFAVSSSFSMSVVICFGLISGMGIATIRAVVMFGLKLLGETLGRTYDYLTAISLSGLMLMLDNPFILYNCAFQMSFAAIIAITLVWPSVRR